LQYDRIDIGAELLLRKFLQSAIGNRQSVLDIQP